ncbi:MAG: polysaccharide deacetylase family protein [Deltaproteobacteria bacterium]|nr:polysaccharide deacetylase family protein [Deltaproteobacteria bacterium]
MPVRAWVKNTIYDHTPGLVRRGPPNAKRVALTFDDGPDHLTTSYLDLLDELGVPATFFVIGARAEANPALVREYLRRGHQVAGHGFDHMRFPKLTRRELLEQITRTDRALGFQITGRSWVRPPHGSIDAASLVTLLTNGYKVAMWSLDSCDYGTDDAGKVVEACGPDRVSAGEVLLFHEGQQWTLDALPRIITGLHAAGYECVTMHDLLAA